MIDKHLIAKKKNHTGKFDAQTITNALLLAVKIRFVATCVFICLFCTF